MTHARTLTFVIAAAAAITATAPADAADLLKLTVGQRGNWDTSISYLGEKAGIFKRGRPAVIGERDPHIRDLLAERARAAGASSVRIASDEFTLHGVEVSDAGTDAETGLHFMVPGTTERGKLSL